MKAIIVILVVVLVLVGLGWMTVRSSGDRTVIEIQQDQIERDTERVVDNVRETGEEVADRVQDAGRNLQQGVEVERPTATVP